MNLVGIINDIIMNVCNIYSLIKVQGNVIKFLFLVYNIYFYFLEIIKMLFSNCL